MSTLSKSCPIYCYEIEGRKSRVNAALSGLITTKQAKEFCNGATMMLSDEQPDPIVQAAPAAQDTTATQEPLPEHTEEGKRRQR